ncbi:hypothetical protein BK664_25770 [Pseudomonas brassicacearum]|uniref:Peptidase C51 domain-containing protein n=1 Tax=Pseudomonas brassicacearum TaxID=930166 RepID=A0A423J6G8_9PSED|nr:hypothetical protein BK664_25770 [Pseudomonas brassicacearum]
MADFGNGVTLIWTPAVDRIGIDPKTNEFVVFDHTGGDDYHGHVRAWNKLHQDMKNVLIKAKKADTKGNILGAKQ